MTGSQLSNATASRQSVLAYLLAAYQVTEIQAINAVSKHQAKVEAGTAARSFAYWVGNLIARTEGFDENPDFDPDESCDEE
jgi:hypothetical protein